MKQRKVNAAAFSRQMAEAVIGDDSLIEVTVNAEQSVWIKIPLGLDLDEDYARAIGRCTAPEELCLEILAHKPGVTAEEQWQVWLDAWGGQGELKAAKLLVNIFATERADAEDRAKNFRYRG